MFVSRPKKVSYNGRQATNQEWRVARKSTSLRVVTLTWDDDKTTDVKVVKGDGRTKNFTSMVDEKNVTQKRVDELIDKHVDK